MFRSSRRKFSLRGSPSSTTSSIKDVSSPLRSPAKRIRLSVEPVLSSTLLEEKTLRETPPPTPEVRLIFRSENLAKQKSESAELDFEIEQKMKQFASCAEEFAFLKVRRSKYDDYAFMVKRLGDNIRNHLNSIFNPGNEFAMKFQETIKEMQSNHHKRFETKSLEWNNNLDQLRSAMNKKAEELKHEIELHRRTVEHNKHMDDMSNAANEMSEAAKAIHQEPENGQAGSVQSVQSLKKDPVNIDDDIQGGNTIDCITLEESDDPIVEREEIVTEQSGAMSDVKDEMDEDATDVEENQNEESASFTPCQAQRVD